MNETSPEEAQEEEAQEEQEESVEADETLCDAGTLVKRSKDVEGPSLWLITFTDIMALMLTFFVLLYSMSVPKEEKWKDMTSALTHGFSAFKAAKFRAGAQDTLDIEKLDFSRALDLNYLNALVQEIIAGDEALQDVVLIPQQDRLIMSLPHKLLFESGQAEITVDGQRALFALGGPLSRIRNRIEIIGHSDPRPVGKTGAFSSNWEISLARAVNVAKILHSVGYTRPMTVRGLSSARYSELSRNLPRQQRLDLSRRVDIVIMKDDGSGKSFLQ